MRSFTCSPHAGGQRQTRPVTVAYDSPEGDVTGVPTQLHNASRADRPQGAAPTFDAGAIVIGVAVLGAGMVAVRNGSVTAPEEAVFRAINDLPDALYPLMWPFQQVGALVVGPVVAVVALALRRVRLAVGALAVTAAKLGSERLVKAIVSRQRPGKSIGPDIQARGDVHLSGESFVSGHAVLVAALAGVVAAHLPPRWRAVPWVLVGFVMVGRVYVGAHNPLDVVCGAALGVAITAAVNLLGARPSAGDGRGGG